MVYLNGPLQQCLENRPTTREEKINLIITILSDEVTNSWVDTETLLTLSQISTLHANKPERSKYFKLANHFTNFWQITITTTLQAGKATATFLSDKTLSISLFATFTEFKSSEEISQRFPHYMEEIPECFFNSLATEDVYKYQKLKWINQM